MLTPSLARLVLLGVIWGGAHTLTRYAVPAFGPVWLVEIRIVMAALMLAAVAWFTARPLDLRTQWRQILVLGAFNTALPFFLLTYAATSLDASVLSVLNASAPVFGAIIGAVWLRTRLDAGAYLGLALGIAGVVVLVSGGLTALRGDALLPVAAALCTSFLYGFSSNYARRHAATLDHFNSAHGSLWVAFVLVLPATPGYLPPGTVDAGVVAAAVALGIVCTGIAYLLYFRLIGDEGPTYALSVAYLIPVFGVLWGVALLGEPITPALVGGGVLILAGVALATGTAQRVLRR